MSYLKVVVAAVTGALLAGCAGPPPGGSLTTSPWPTGPRGQSTWVVTASAVQREVEILPELPAEPTLGDYLRYAMLRSDKLRTAFYR